MLFRILGRTELHVDTNSIDLGAAKPRALLGLLLLNVGRPVPVDLIIDQLWQDRPGGDVRGNLYSLISRLRAVLRRAGVPYELRYDLDAYRLDLDPLLVDYHRFRSQVADGAAAGRAGDHERAIGLLGSAIAIWRGDPLAELRTDWAARRRGQMVENDLLPAHHSLSDSELALRRYGDVLARIDPIMEDRPLDEILALHRIRALDGLGRLIDLTHFYATFRQRMRTELGAEPGPELREAYLRALGRRTSGDRPAAVVGSAAHPRSESRVPWQLPRVTPDLACRDDLLATLDALLLDSGRRQSAPVVALHGMPGVGKTTLAVSWGNLRRDRFPDGCLYVDLNGYGQGRPTTADDAVASLLDALEIPPEQVPTAGDQRRARLGRILANRKMLMILDNVRDSTHARPVLSTAGSECAVLITSRTRISGLAIRDWVRTVAVNPLAATASKAWLRTELGEARVERDPPSLEALVALSAGLPLALKIIAQHAAHRAHTELADIVHELRSHELVAAAPASEDEDTTLSKVFSWSYDTLPPPAQRLFRLLGLHPGRSFSTFLAMAASDEFPAETERSLGILVAGHLLEPDGPGRYRFHDLIHHYAADRATAYESHGQRLASLTRMADWYLRTADNAGRRLAPQGEPVRLMQEATDVEPLTFDVDDDALRWCNLELDNLIAITYRAAEHQLHGHAWRIPAIIGDAVERSGHRDDFLQVLQVALDSARLAGDSEGEVWLLNFLGGSYLFHHDQTRAMENFRAALVIAEKIGHADGEAASRHNLGSVYLQLGDAAAAIQLFEEALRQDRARQAADGEAYSLHQLASAYRRLGEYDTALRHYHDALRIRREIGHLRGQGDTLTHLAALHYEQGRYAEARDYCFQALDVHKRSQDKVKTTETLVTLASVYYATGLHHDAIRQARRAIEICEETQSEHALERALHVLADALDAIDDHDAAQDVRQRAAGT